MGEGAAQSAPSFGGHSTVLTPTASSHPQRAIEYGNYMPCSMRGSLLVCDKEARTKKEPASSRDWQSLGDLSDRCGIPGPSQKLEF